MTPRENILIWIILTTGAVVAIGITWLALVLAGVD